jgi:hypothetical protein
VLAILLNAFKLSWSCYEEGHTPLIRGVGIGTTLVIIAVCLGNMFGDRFSYISLNSWMFAMFAMCARSRVWIDEHRRRLDADAKAPFDEDRAPERASRRQSPSAGARFDDRALEAPDDEPEPSRAPRRLPSRRQ